VPAGKERRAEKRGFPPDSESGYVL
jgi:hypothetical protein